MRKTKLMNPTILPLSTTFKHKQEVPFPRQRLPKCFKYPVGKQIDKLNEIAVNNTVNDAVVISSVMMILQTNCL